MNTRQLGIVAVLAVLSVGATAAVLRTGAPTLASDRRGERVLPGLAEKAKDITNVMVHAGSDTLSIERRDNAFVASDSGFPIKPDAVRDLLGGSVELTFEEARTSDPSRYGDLGLADPGAGDDGGKEITLRAASGEVADFILGNRDNTVGGPIGGQYLRLKGAPQTWLVRGSLTLPASRADWFAPVDLGIKRNEIKKIELAGGGREAVTAAVTAEKPDELVLQDVPDKRVPDAFKVGRFPTLIESFAFQDVRKKSKPADDARRLSVDVGDALRLVITSVGELSDGWVQIAAQPTSDAARERAKAINAKIEGYDFRLPPQQIELLGWTLSDLTNEPKS